MSRLGLASAMSWLAKQIGPDRFCPCAGCGYYDACRKRGCAILRKALAEVGVNGREEKQEVKE